MLDHSLVQSRRSEPQSEAHGPRSEEERGGMCESSGPHIKHWPGCTRVPVVPAPALAFFPAEAQALELTFESCPTQPERPLAQDHSQDYDPIPGEFLVPGSRSRLFLVYRDHTCGGPGDPG